MTPAPAAPAAAVVTPAVATPLAGAPVVGVGTLEAEWAAWPVLAALPTLSGLPVRGAGPGLAPLVVAPHPDDEVLGAGGLLALAGGDVVAVTDGEASHPGSTVFGALELAAARRGETRAALTALGRPGTRVHHLGHPDGSVDEALLTEQLGALLTAGRWCVTTWRADGHPDHEATGRAAAAACVATGARLVEYPVWTWHWARPEDPRVPWSRARRLPLDAPTRAAKSAAVDCFTTQVRPIGPDTADAPVLPAHVLARFARPFEVFFT